MQTSNLRRSLMYVNNDKLRVLKHQPRKHVIGSFMVTDIDLNNNLATAHFTGGGSTKIDISQYVDKIKSMNNPEIFYISY